MEKNITNLWVAYDMRATSGDTDDASVLVASDNPISEREIRQSYGQGVIYKYDVKSTKNQNELINESLVQVVA